MAKPEYRTIAYRTAKVEMRGAPCAFCGAPSNSVDHFPPISKFPPGRWRGVLRPACTPCQINQGKQLMRDMFRDPSRRPPQPSRAW